MFAFLRRLFPSSTISEASQEEQTACLEAVIFSLFADKRYKLTEQLEFRQFCRRVSWKVDLDSMIKEIQPRALEAFCDDETMIRYVEGVKSKITSKAVGSSILNFCNDISYDTHLRHLGFLDHFESIEK
ncbi:MAG: hypothetical protein QGG64_11455 [Candidatus Latescibacteria bacterium]|jgi:hypothetical protein|nr:hypothetical protein [Candidatus Latescibacterota bacterium]